MSRVEPPYSDDQVTRLLSAPAVLPAVSAKNERPSGPNAATLCAADIRRDDLTGLQLGPYELGAKVGGGGMGKVFRARHRHLGRDFAIKFVAAEMSGHPEAQRRFELETKALGKLQHPQIVNAIDAGAAGGLLYLVTELVDGEDWASLVRRRGPLPVREACELARQAAIGLAHSHAAGFVHRDIKPSNLMVDRTGTVKILDFGLVHAGHAEQPLTEVGATLGTWDFMAPEQAHDSREVDHRCDLYGLGGTLLFLLSGDVPFGGGPYSSPAAKIKGHLFDTPPWLAAPQADVPGELIAALHRLLEKSPAKRFASAADVAAALAPFAAECVVPRQSPMDRPRHRWPRWAMAAALACLIAVAGWRGFSSVAPEAPAEQVNLAPAATATVATEPAAPPVGSHSAPTVTSTPRSSVSASPPRFAISPAKNHTPAKATQSNLPTEP